MGRRIDLGDNGSDDSLEDAMRQLERQLGKKREAAREEPTEEQLEAAERAEPAERADEDEAKRRFEEERRAGHRRTREGIQDALEAIGREQRAVAARRPRRGRAARVAWLVLGLAALAGIAVAGVKLRPEPLPPPAPSAEQAVEGFWRTLIAGKYEAATVYYPALVDRYGSRKQAALHLRDQFERNPPIEITQLGEAEELPDSEDLRVPYEVCLRNGWPRTGEFIVRYSGGPATGYVIVAAP